MISTNEFYTWVGKVENKGNYSILFASTTREDKKKEKFYSNWIIRCIGESHDKVMTELMEKYVDGEQDTNGYLKKKIGIKVTRGQFTNEPYTNKDGKKVYNNNQLVAWEWEFGNFKKKESQDEPSPKKADSKKKPSPFDGEVDEDE